MNDITININGGNNQILPNATEAVQNFYGDQFAEKILKHQTTAANAPLEADKLSLYINKVNIPGYVAQINECQSATELAQIVMSMLEQEPKLTDELVVKERFITLLLPLAYKMDKGRSIDNIRARINDALMARPKPSRNIK